MSPLANRVRSSRIRRCLAFSAVAATSALVAAACGSSAPPSAASAAPTSFAAATQAAKPTLLVWVDSTRLPVAQQYQKAHPEVQLKIVTYNGDAAGSNYLQTKVELFNRAGNGWPDVVFSESYADMTWATEPSINFAAPLDKVGVSAATLKGFATNALSVCTFTGGVYCLRNDLAQDVLWYNTKLMKQFGYKVPTTWEAYQALGLKVAKQHPGYLVGTVGDSYADEVYFQASECPANQLTAATTLHVDTADPKCTRMASLLDPLIKAKSLSIDSAFSAGFVKNNASKVLMNIGPSWYGQYLFNASFKTPAGQVMAAAPPKWASDGTQSTGDVGGGVWLVSRHSKSLAAASAMITAITTSPTYQNGAPTYPASKAAATSWLAVQNKQKYFAGDVGPVFVQAAGLVWSGWSATKYSSDAVWASTVVPGLTAGKTLTSLLPAWQTAIRNQAQSVGYTVN